METKRKRSGLPIIIIGGGVLAWQLSKMNSRDEIRNADYVILIAAMVYIAIGIYAYVKSGRNSEKIEN